MAAALDGFAVWLDKKLKDLNTDEGVFGSYIIGILDGDETKEEKNEAIEGILSEILSQDIDKIRNEIMDMWCKFRLPKANNCTKASNEDVDVKLARLLESQALQTTKQKNYTEEEKRIREAILSQYSQTTDDEEVETVTVSGENKENGLEKNRNAQSVMQAEKEKREQSKLESLKKKEKDREDREKQKQLKEEKKEKRKTQKGERRR